jgi:hypothetical protein
MLGGHHEFGRASRSISKYFGRKDWGKVWRKHAVDAVLSLCVIGWYVMNILSVGSVVRIYGLRNGIYSCRFKSYEELFIAMNLGTY